MTEAEKKEAQDKANLEKGLRNNPFAGLRGGRSLDATTSVRADTAWNNQGPTFLSEYGTNIFEIDVGSAYEKMGPEAKLIFLAFAVNAVSFALSFLSICFISTRYTGTKLGCPCGLRRKVKFEDLLKQYDESELDATVSDLEAEPLIKQSDIESDTEAVIG